MELDQGAVWSSWRRNLRQIKDGPGSARLEIVQGGSRDDHLGYSGSNIMIARLTVAERQSALLILIVMSFLGLAMAVAGRGTPFGLHGFLVIAASIGVGLPLLRKFYAPEPDPAQFEQYYDDPTKVGIVLAMLWAIAGMFVGVWVAALLAWPDLTIDAAWASFGRLRPIHTSGVIFGFGGNALIATSFHVLQRTSRARLPDQLSPWFVLLGYNLFCVVAATGYMMGVTQSKEYAEPEWYADIWLVIVWVVYFLIYIRTLARRKEPHIYVANWYYMAFILVVAILHIVNNLAVPVSFGDFKSYSAFSGVQDAMTQWWYGHNAVAFFLTAGFLGMLYYYLPKRAGRPIFSYRLSIISFWGITFMYMWAGSHHLHYTALPQWVQTLGMTFSIVLLVPSWASAGNALATLNGAWHKVRDDATLRFMMVAAVFYGISTFEGSFMAIRAVNSLSHYTDWTVGHVHAGALGWVAMITFGSIYALVPWMWKRETMYSARLIEVHFWLALAGTVVYVFAMWNSGIIQGLMWRTYTDSGTLAYSFIDSLVAMHPYYIARAFGGLLFLLGAIVGTYNVLMTIRVAKREQAQSGGGTDVPSYGRDPVLQAGE
jgi:cytochrome c oxidase cbb3-type subunit I